jgi:hypothetical protein
MDKIVNEKQNIANYDRLQVFYSYYRFSIILMMKLYMFVLKNFFNTIFMK